MDTAALKASWGKVAANGDDVPLYFYSHLFLSHPEVRSMFPIQMTAQREKLVTALGAVVSNVESLDDVVPILEQLGRDHRRFSVVTEHYSAVGASLLATLKRFLGASWTPELADTWAQAYGVVAKVMVAAAEQHEEVAPAWWEADVVRVERRSVEVAVIEVVPREPFPYRAGQSVAVEIPQRPRLWRYFSPANAPDPSGRLQFHVQPIAGGLVSTAAVRRLSQGDTIKLAAPVGEQLTLPENGALPDLLMVAGGTGLAPLRAVLEQIDRGWESSGFAPRVHLFHGSRMPWNLYDHEHLSRLARKPWFDYTPVVSEDQTYFGAQGLVASVAAKADNWSQRTAMVCGSPAMVRHAVTELEAVGVPATSIRREQFDFRGDASPTRELQDAWETR
ncbi:MAG TPA: globin domain-containing protein [Propionibacteriaceae bacterium]|nr:globin domain-containing protein [Propionibacteriaceae bacterium]